MLLHRNGDRRRGSNKGYLGWDALRGATFVLIALTVLTPFESAFAQSADASATASSDAATSGTSTLGPDQTNINTSTAQPSTTENTPAPTDTTSPPSAPLSDSGNTPTTVHSNAPANATPAGRNGRGVATPSGGNPPENPDPQPIGYSSFSQDHLVVDKNTGALNTTYPITIPPGRNNLQPDLNLVYNSQDSQLGNIFGEGWTISIPYIERLNKTGVDNLYSTSTPDYFTSSLDGELATTTVSSSYIARTESGTFNKYTFSNNQWVMTDKNGTQYAFGSTADSVQSDPNNASDTYKWMLKTVTDTNGNTVMYSYVDDFGQIYPSSTLYTSNGSSTGMFEVDFLRTASTDNATSSATGFPVNSNYRVSEIDAKVSGTWVRKYALAYTTGSNGLTTLLSSITESGQNASGTVVTLPPTTFTYQTQTPGWTSSSTWDSPVSFYNSTNNDNNGVRIADANGDGLPDLIQGVGNPTGTLEAWVNNGHGWTVSSTWEPPVNLLDQTNNEDYGVRFVDVNGDGLPDILQGIGDIPGNPSGTIGAWINTGHGWVASSTWDPPTFFLDYYNNEDYGVRIVDVNGDGLPDIIQGVGDDPHGSTSTSYAAWINNGHGWTLNTAWDPPTPFLDWWSNNDYGVRIADLNGDGLPDIFSSSAAWINNGHGWTGDPSWVSPTSFYDATDNEDYGVRIADVNGDGLPDIIQGVGDDPHGSTSTFYAAWINTGHGWTARSSWDPPTPFLDWWSNDDYGVRIADVNGDGLPDIFSSSAAYLNNNSSRADLLTGVTYPQGGSSAIAYQSATQFTDGSGNLLNNEPYPVYVVSKLTQNDGAGNLSSSTYQYSGGTFYYNSSTYPYDKQFAGFSLVTETDPAGNVTKTYYHTGNGTDSAHGEYNDNFWKIGKPYRVEVYDQNWGGVLEKVTINKWDSTSLGGNAAFVLLDQTVELDCDESGFCGDGQTHKDKAESYTYNNATGNQTQKIQWGQVTADNNGSFTDTGTDDFTTNTTYASSTTSSVIGKPSDVIMLDHYSNKIKETQYYYDALALGNIGAGNLTEEADWIATSTYATTEHSYNSYGLVTKTLDPRNNTTTYSYDAYNLYPATTTNALSQSTGNLYDYSTGKATQTIDPNNDVFQTTYDGLGRPLQVIQPDPNASSTPVVKTAYAYTDTSNAVSVEESDNLSATTTVNTYRYYDGLDRVIQTRKSAEDAGNYKVTDSAYNNVGLLSEQSFPYFATGTGKTAATSTSSLFTTYDYDGQGRILLMVTAVISTSTTYAPWEIGLGSAYDNRYEYFDAYGNLIELQEVNGSSIYDTYYTYDGLNDLTSITDDLGNVRNFTYDGLGRRLTAQDLHAATDTTYGTWNYTYDNAGNLTQTVDPKSQTVNYAYDHLNRVSTENYTGQSGTEFTYTYDSCAQGKTRLCNVSSTTDVVSNTYNSLGQLAQQSQTIASSTYTTSYTYDRQGNQVTITNPDNSVIEYTYGAAGLPNEVLQKPSGGSFVPVVTSLDYSPTDQPSTVDYQNGVAVTNFYDPTEDYWLGTKVATLPAGGTAQNVTYYYDGGGHIGQLIDTSTSGAGRTVEYTYDQLGHLTNASTTNVSSTPSYNQTFTYDPLGNITSGPVGTYSYQGNTGTNYADPDAATSMVTSGGIGTITFDASSSKAFNSGTTTWGGASITVGTSSINEALIITIAAGGSGTSTKAVTVDGVNATKVVGSTGAAAEDAEVWYALNLSHGVHNVSATFGVAMAGVIGLTSFSGVNQTTPVDATSTGGANTEPASSTLTTTVANDLIIDTIDHNFATTTAIGSSQTLLFKDLGEYKGNASYILGTSTRAYTSQYTLSSSTMQWRMAQAAFRPASVTSTNTLAYDNDGNLISSGNATNTWDYRNELIQSVTGAGTSTYGYDYLGNRVLLTQGTSTTVFPTTFYNVMLGGAVTSTKHVFVDGMLVATIQNASGTASTVRYVLGDNLGGTSVVTNASGTISEVIDYYPYGQARIDVPVGSYSGEMRKFIGQQYDAATGLNYLNARYYNGSQGQFLSEDPVFLGDPKSQQIDNPQSLNSYAYSEDNPITLTDPSGKFAGVDDLADIIGGGSVGFGAYALSSLINHQQPTWGGAAGAFVTGAAVTWGVENAPISLGSSLALSNVVTGVVYGGAGSFVGNLVKQGINIGTGNQQGGLNGKELLSNSAFGAVSAGLIEGVVPNAEIEGLSAGQGNWNSIGEQLETKLQNGTISNVSFSSMLKSEVGSQASNLYRTIGSAGADYTYSTYQNYQRSSQDQTNGYWK